MSEPQTSNPNYGRKVPDYFGRLYTDDQPQGYAGTWVRRAEVDALLDEIATLRRRLETSAPHCRTCKCFMDSCGTCG